ncbi:beta carbonic anhydrase 6, mitochondrial-like isoform X3 [Mangifera indica]|uniref:beta carbonic anhydrase 6, mitochondrial-like isoform X3 n=1 Tax=Mangifera indica TaxID=29780 RepID=UPI001CF96803|nr:beta carbonic anhydrase 6, mitochondrial-like isoform X3 [Mangifera indica]
MVWWSICSKARFAISSMAAQRTSIVYGDSFQCSSFSVLSNPFTGFPRKFSGLNTTRFANVCDNYNQLGFISSLKNPILKLEGSNSAQACIQECTSHEEKNVAKTYHGRDFFEEMKQRFLSFKKHKYFPNTQANQLYVTFLLVFGRTLQCRHHHPYHTIAIERYELEHFQALAQAQSPEVMVIACVDSRICPSNILGFQPGETFMIRNVANLVPPIHNGPSETNAALEFAVNTLEVEDILIIGHSDCGGIQALMTMQEGNSSNLTEKWVATAKAAKLKTKADVAHLSFEQQCRYCEKESINRSLLNLLTYPWIEDRVRKESLSLHGGYYDLFNCTFEKWTLDYRESSIDEEGGKYTIKDRSFWC